MITTPTRASRLALAGPLALAVLLALGAAPAAAAQKDGSSPAPRAPSDVPPCPSNEAKPDVDRLVERTKKLLEGSSQTATFRMHIETEDWTRDLKLQSWSKGDDYALIRVVEGSPRETGMMTLKREDQLWNYLPQAGRVMKLPSGMLGDSWMGSDFTNDDLIRGTSLTEDYDAEVTGIEQVAMPGGDGSAPHEAWRIRLVPKRDSVVVWGRVEMLVDRQSCLPLRQVFYDEDGEAVRRLEFGDFRTVGWREFPAKMTVIPLDENRRTSIQYEEVEFDSHIPDETFGLRRLRQGR